MKITFGGGLDKHYCVVHGLKLKPSGYGLIGSTRDAEEMRDITLGADVIAARCFSLFRV